MNFGYDVYYFSWMILMLHLDFFYSLKINVTIYYSNIYYGEKKSLTDYSSKNGKNLPPFFPELLILSCVSMYWFAAKSLSTSALFSKEIYRNLERSLSLNRETRYILSY